MKNADMPAIPTGMQLGNDDPESMFHPDGIMQCTGLTKREVMAMHMMQGLVSAWGQHDVTSSGELASDAVMMADSLLAELERTK